MASGKTHVVVGGLLVVGLYFLYKKVLSEKELTWKGTLGCFCLGAIFGLAPDLLEPALHPNHRQFFHSIGLVLIFLFIKKHIFQKMEVKPEVEQYLNWGFSAYGAHLFLDVLTPKGLPIL